MNRLTRAAFAFGLILTGMGIAAWAPVPRAQAAMPMPETAPATLEPGMLRPGMLEPHVTLLEMHPTEPFPQPGTKLGLPLVVRPGVASAPDTRQVPATAPGATPGQEAAGPYVAKAGTGFFVGSDGTLLTAAHVVQGCTRTQIVSQHVNRAWVSVVASDAANDIAILKAADTRPPAVASIGNHPPMGQRLFILGYPTSTTLTVAAETWAFMENRKFPATVGALAHPQDMIWMSAPAVTHGYSGGPILDPRTGTVVGMVKGTVDGGYLRLIQDMPTTGVAIGPGIAPITALLRQNAPFAAVTLAASGGDGLDTLRRATVHVLCWR